MSEATVGKAIDDGATQIAGKGVVDDGANECSDGGAEHNEEHVGLRTAGSELGSRGNHHLAGERDGTALGGDQQGDDSMIEGSEAPGYEGEGLHGCLVVWGIGRLVVWGIGRLVVWGIVKC